MDKSSYIKILQQEDISGYPRVRNPPCNAADMGWRTKIPDACEASELTSHKKGSPQGYE